MFYLLETVSLEGFANARTHPVLAEVVCGIRFAHVVRFKSEGSSPGFPPCSLGEKSSRCFMASAD
jgi:hypothetical protein